MRFKGKYFFLSNFYPCSLRSWGFEYSSSEALYVACKTPPDRMDVREQISVECDTGAKAKRFGKREGFPLRDDWMEIRLEVMEAILRKKFSVPTLAKKLAAIDVEIEESNYWHDRFWGRCYCQRCDGRGENQLGKIFEKIKMEAGN